jgi:catechol 2,3-dioxygenase-like lactoylglutathione lyase family enzyme
VVLEPRAAWKEWHVDWKLETVLVPVTDVDRAKDFYAGKLGFREDTDYRAGEGFRVVQVTPPGSACSIVFGQGMPSGAPGSLKGSQFVVVDVEAAAAAGRAAEVTGADPALAGLAGLLAARPHELEGLVAGLGLDAERRGRAVRAARSAPALANELRADAAPSDLHRLLHEEPPEALALSVALGAPPNAVSRYLGEVAGVALEIGGDDLVAAGVEPSAAIGRALEKTLRRKLDGRVAGRDEELRCALRLALGEDGDAR